MKQSYAQKDYSQGIMPRKYAIALPKAAEAKIRHPGASRYFELGDQAGKLIGRTDKLSEFHYMD